MALSSHQKRWVTAFFLAPTLLAFFFLSPAWAFMILAIAVSALALWEYFKNFCKARSILDFGFILAVFLGSMILVAAWAGSFRLMFVALWMALFVFAGRAMIRFNQGKHGFEKLTVEALSILYIPCMISSLVLLRGGDKGVTWMMLPLWLAFMSDTGAFYAGTYLGRHKLIPALSPNKTVEGSVGSILMDLAVATVFKLFFLPELSWAFLLVLAVCAALATQMGDLFESMIKRSFGVKDMGGIFPGHGGMMDRIDGMLFTAPVVYCFKVFATF
ncbi:MAG: phosphatidate cytidylyltransferase [Proteobacteria bacterium]|nr:phosphatidate cytidylyltransferase [Pseudomonadota bacterium]